MRGFWLLASAYAMAHFSNLLKQAEKGKKIWVNYTMDQEEFWMKNRFFLSTFRHLAIIFISANVF